MNIPEGYKTYTVINRQTNRPIMEVSNRALLANLNPAKFLVVGATPQQLFSAEELRAFAESAFCHRYFRGQGV